MKAVKYRWSGDHKTVIDVGNLDTELESAVSCAISMYEKELAEKRSAGGPMSDIFIEALEADLKSLNKLKDIFNNVEETTDQDEAKMLAGELF